jgi:hypothetical protein
LSADPHASALEAIGIQRGEEVRFRRADRARWQPGRVDRLERDGSLRVTDADGAARTVALALVQVRRSPTGSRWQDAVDRAGQTRQLTLSW